MSTYANIIPAVLSAIYIFVLIGVPAYFIGGVLGAPLRGKGTANINRVAAMFVATVIALILSNYIPLISHQISVEEGMKPKRTDSLLNQIEQGMIAYETEYGTPPHAADNKELTDILLGKNQNGIVFVTVRQDQLNASGEILDDWGTPLRFNFGDPTKPKAQSAGPDKTWNTPDDLGK